MAERYILGSIRFGTNDKGRPSTRFVDCLEDGKPVTYESKYEFIVLAVTINGQRLDFGMEL